jgi:hypothetical protein
MAEHNFATRVVQLTAGLVSSGVAVTAAPEVDFPSNATLILDVLAAGTSWNMALSTGTASGAAGSSVSISGAANVSGTGSGIFSYHLNDKLSKYVYANLSGAGTPTVAAVLYCQGYANSAEVVTAATVIIPTEA